MIGAGRSSSTLAEAAVQLRTAAYYDDVEACVERLPRISVDVRLLMDAIRQRRFRVTRHAPGKG